MAQGNLAVGGLGVSGKDGSKLTVNVPTVGRIADGASVERAVATGFDSGEVVRYNLFPDFLTADSGCAMRSTRCCRAPPRSRTR
jgi:flagellar P-ring protein precursor FlgI